jgi:hypothetical protein
MDSLARDGEIVVLNEPNFDAVHRLERLRDLLLELDLHRLRIADDNVIYLPRPLLPPPTFEEMMAVVDRRGRRRGR